MRHWTVNYVLDVLEKKDWSANRLATEAGVAASTINRPIREQDWAYGLSAATVSKVHRASGIDPAPYMPDGMSEPAQMYRARPETNGDRVLRNMPGPNQTSGHTDVANSIEVSVSGGYARIVALVDKDGIAQLRKKLDALEALIDDT